MIKECKTCGHPFIAKYNKEEYGSLLCRKLSYLRYDKDRYYKSKEKLENAYWFYKNRDKINAKKNQAKKFLKENLQIKRLLNNYFSAQNYVYAFKDGEELTMESFLDMLKEEGNFEAIRKLNDNKDIWRSLLYATHNKN